MGKELNDNNIYIDNVKINLSYYKGVDLYSDGYIEDKILEFCKNGTEKELLYNSSEYAVLYHLSEIRNNVIEWFPIDNEESILEIGSGCGGVTGILSQKGRRVTCIELSKKRSLINAYRHKDRDNIEIVVGNLCDIEDNLGRYDVVTIIGVWEYSAAFIDSTNPYLDMLKIAQRHLNEDGRLFIAIENKMGLKYWNGAVEDHTGKQYSGINGYLDNETVRTFSKHEIEELLGAAGIIDYEFHYPVPDYKLPLCVYSDSHLPKPGDIRTFHDNYDAIRVYNFNEAAAFDQICRDNMFSYFSNSFIITTGRTSNIAYAKYNSLRKKEFKTSIKISEKKETRQVYREAMTESAVYHIKRLSSNNCTIGAKNQHLEKGSWNDGVYCTTYYRGKSLGQLLYSYISEVNLFIGECKRLIDFYFSFADSNMIPFINTREFRSVFGLEYPFESKSLLCTNIDMNFFNMIPISDDEVAIIDNEWCFEFPIPYDFIIWRNLYTTYHIYIMYLNRKTDSNEIYKAFGFNDDKIEVFSRMEIGFQEYVYGKKDEHYLEKYRKTAMMSEIKLW